jgi:hypothetical protein
MSRSLKIAFWAVVLVGCAALGAFVASRSHPFPPDVSGRENAHERPTRLMWAVSLQLRTTHTPSSGNSCSATWDVKIVFPNFGRAPRGTGTATRVGDLRCDASNAQREADAMKVPLRALLRGPEFRIRLASGPLSPEDAQELSGLAPVVDGLHLHLETGSSAPVRREVEDGRGGLSVGVGRATIRSQ